MTARLPIALLFLTIPAVPAQSLTLDLPGEEDRRTVAYACSDGAERDVEYVNLGSNSLALFEVEKERRVFVNVISASGARYVSGEYVWWSKGREASFENEMGEADAEPVTCEEVAS